MAEYIVAIDLGTSHLTGIVGEKKEDGKFSILACETEDTIPRIQKGETEESNSCIYRGIIYNRDNTAKYIRNLIGKLEGRLNGDTIEKVYVGVGGQSLRTIDHSEELEIEDGAVVTEKDLAVLKEQCEYFKPGLLDVLGMAPAVYYLGGRKDTKPVGVSCKRLKANYKLIVGRSSIRTDITKCIEMIPDKTLAGIFVSPLALADAVLSPKDKEIGCALVDFGAGVTSVSVYKDGDLQHLCVIPFGGNLITRDLTTLQLTKEEAEKLKIDKGSAKLNTDDKTELIKIETDGADREIKLSDLNTIIEARTKEIVENVYARIAEVINNDFRQLGSGIVLAGCAAELADLPEHIKEKNSRLKVRFSMLQNDLIIDSEEMESNPLYLMAISLMLKGTESCITKKQTVVEVKNNPPIDIGIKVRPEKQKPGGGEVKKPKGPGLKERLAGIFTTNLFEEE
jgi:cell division protein FtsA